MVRLGKLMEALKGVLGGAESLRVAIEVEGKKTTDLAWRIDAQPDGGRELVLVEMDRRPLWERYEAQTQEFREFARFIEGKVYEMGYLESAFEIDKWTEEFVKQRKEKK